MTQQEWTVKENLWMVVNEETNSIVYNCAAPDRVKAYEMAGKVLGEPPYTTKQMRDMGYKAVKIKEIAFA